MKESERHDRIVEYLRIRPINHGLIYTFQMAIPNSNLEISSERRKYLSRSLTEKGTNLISLIVRRTQAYDEEKEYEVVYGADWCLVAQELNIEKLWVWVFDMTDEEATLAKTEMEQLTSATTPLTMKSIEPVSSVSETLDIKNLQQQWEQSLEQKLAAIKINIDFQSLLSSIEQLIDQKLEPVKAAIDTLQKPSIIIEDTERKVPDSKKQKNDKINYSNKTVPELRKIATQLNIAGRSNMNKAQLINAIIGLR